MPAQNLPFGRSMRCQIADKIIAHIESSLHGGLQHLTAFCDRRWAGPQKHGHHAVPVELLGAVSSAGGLALRGMARMPVTAALGDEGGENPGPAATDRAAPLAGGPRVG